MTRFALALTLGALAATVSAAEPPDGFTRLFNGQNLDGWRGWDIHSKGGDPASVASLSSDARAAKFAAWAADAQKHWSVQNGDLVNDGHGAFLSTIKDYGDIELSLEYKTVAKADSGVYLRGTPQVQIWDTTEQAKFKHGADKGSGGLWNNAAGTPGKDPLAKADKPFGEWNQMRILQIGARTTVYLNGKLVVDFAPMQNYWDRKKPLPARGPILLQTHGGAISWRNVFVREIPVAEANATLMGNAGKGFTELFDGQSLAGWKGATGDYEVKNGAIVCKPKRGGNLYCEGEYGDFIFQVEYQLPKGGNNGLAIRYPGAGDPAYVAMGEVQVLDDGDPMYAKIDPRQASGSLYGVFAAARGYQRPAGEWNVMTVTAKGPTIAVDINGTEVTSGDVSKAKDFMAKHPHPGLTRAKGHLGFAGHNDPVAFRRARVKALGGE